MTPLRLGVSFSASHAGLLGLNPERALESCCSWPISVLRLGAYWNQIEALPGKYDFSALKKQLTQCQKSGKKVILTVGVKAPRWPEFYFPDHIQPNLKNLDTGQSLLNFVSATIQATQSFSCIMLWQIENEPLDPSGPENWQVPPDLLLEESSLIHQLDSRPQLTTLWGNNLTERDLFTQVAALSDHVGLDLYYKQFVGRWLGKNFYRGPLDSDEVILDLIQQSPKPVWIAELQAEPWEQDHAGYLSTRPGSLNVQQLQKNWARVHDWPLEGVLFWGAEYWLWQSEQGNPEFVEWLAEVAQSV